MAESRPVQFLEDVACQFIEQSLINSGLSKTYAKQLSKSACKNLVAPTVEGLEKVGSKVKSKLKRKKTPRDKVLSQELAIMNKRARLKDGSFRNGWDQRKVMQLAQKATSKRMKQR